MTRVSFIVPTLNRGHYVLRAVESCLGAGDMALMVQTEVVVLDSQSDDGSWELLQEKFGADTRVKLIQNKRGLGPTHSWIDGVNCATGDYLTFVWSDDYVSPRFISQLLPLLNEQTHVAIGVGVMRDVDDVSPLLPSDVVETFSSGDYLAGFFRPYGGATPDFVSPVCALFSRQVFDRWKEVITDWGRATQLREQVIWKRAIGPDLILYFLGALSGEKVAFTREQVAQFSAHPGSISMFSSKYLLRSGYWLARCWLVKDSGLKDNQIAGRLTRITMETWLSGRHLTRLFPGDTIKGHTTAETRRWIRDECSSVLVVLRQHQSLRACIGALARALIMRVLPRRYRKATM